MALEWEEAFDDAVAVASSSPLGYHWGLGVAIVELSVSRALYLSPVSRLSQYPPPKPFAIRLRGLPLSGTV